MKKLTRIELLQQGQRLPDIRPLNGVPPEGYVKFSDDPELNHPFIQVIGQHVLDLGGFAKRCTDALPLASVGGGQLQTNPVLAALACRSLYKIPYPTPSLIRLHGRVLETLVLGYIDRNPLFDVEWNSVTHFLQANTVENIQKVVLAAPSTNVPSIFVVGASGMGKTFAMEFILSLLPDVVKHVSFNGVALNHVQVIHLYVQCPPTGTLKALLFNILLALDFRLGTRFFHTWQSSIYSVDVLMVNVALILFNHGIGVLVLDELQHLKARTNAEAEQSLNFFVSLMNFLKVPLVCVGTYAAMDVLTGTLRNGRRLGSNGSIDFELYPKGSAVTHSIEDYYLSHLPGLSKRPLTDEFRKSVREIYQGLHFLLPNLVHRCTVETIYREKEFVSDEVLLHYRNVELKPIKGALDALRSNSPDRIQLFDDLMSNDAIKALQDRQQRMGAESKRDSSDKQGATRPLTPGSGSGETVSEFPHHDISVEEIRHQCGLSKALFGDGDVYPMLKSRKLLATRLAYGELPPNLSSA